MACPYFDPVSPRTPDIPPETATLPLGDIWSGVCRAVPETPMTPDATTEWRCCNFGYARRSCDRFPKARKGPDAARFAVRRDKGGIVTIYFVLERDHHPFSHGALEWSRQDGSFTTVPSSTLLLRQATAYVSSYLRRKTAARER
jgi:hypothetical protein